MSAFARKFPSTLLVLVLLSLAGCESEEGERCYLDGDCSGSLICCKASSSSTVDGFCSVEDECMPEEDAGPTPGTDAGIDAGLDAGTPPP